MKHIYCATDSTSCHTGPQIRCKYICNLNININTDVFELEQQPQHDILGKHISVCTGLKISSFPTNQHKFGFKARLENKVQCVSWKHNISTGRIQTVKRQLPLLFCTYCPFSFCLESEAFFLQSGKHPSYCMMQFLLPRFAVWQDQIIFGNTAGHSPGQFLKVTNSCFVFLVLFYRPAVAMHAEYIW